MVAQGDHRFKSLSPQIDLPATERQILDFWDANEIFAKSVSARAAPPDGHFSRDHQRLMALPALTILRLEHLRIYFRAITL